MGHAARSSPEDMVDFQVVAEMHRDLHDERWVAAGFQTPSAEQPPPRTGHLIVPGAGETLCAEPVSRFVPLDGEPETHDVVWCWLCRLTAGQ
jgi:hypothetical protein